jgi:hypothetical protein
MRIHNLPKPGGAQVRAMCLTLSHLATVDDTFGLGARMSVQGLERGVWSFEVSSVEVFLGQVGDLAAVLEDCAGEGAFLLLESEG